jgi:hypothetical protein
MRRRFVTGMAVGLLAAVAFSSSAFAASPSDPSDAADAIHVVVHKVSTKTSAGGARLAAVAATTRCYYAYWIAQSKNNAGTVNFQYKEQVEWCANNGKITSDSRFTQPITPRPWLWQFASETLFERSYNAAHSSVSYSARGLFNQVAPSPIGWIIVGQSHPLVKITANANGTASGSISW